MPAMTRLHHLVCILAADTSLAMRVHAGTLWVCKDSDLSIGHRVGGPVLSPPLSCNLTMAMSALPGLSFLDELASMNGASADASLAEDEEKLFNLFFSDGLEPSLGLQASGDFPELAPLTEPSDTAEDSAEALAPPPAPTSRRKAPQAPQRSLKAASQSQEKSRCGTRRRWHRRAEWHALSAGPCSADFATIPCMVASAFSAIGKSPAYFALPP